MECAGLIGEIVITLNVRSHGLFQLAIAVGQNVFRG